MLRVICSWLYRLVSFICTGVFTGSNTKMSPTVRTSSPTVGTAGARLKERSLRLFISIEAAPLTGSQAEVTSRLFLEPLLPFGAVTRSGSLGRSTRRNAARRVCGTGMSRPSQGKGPASGHSTPDRWSFSGGLQSLVAQALRRTIGLFLI
jgi:hypothetical protein